MTELNSQEALALRLFSSGALGPFFLYIGAIVNHPHCSRRSSGGWWMFIASERLLGFSNLQHCCFFVWGLKTPSSTFPSSQALIFQLDRWCQVIYIPYVMCGSTLPLGRKCTFLMTAYLQANDYFNHLMTRTLDFFSEKVHPVA